jgi:O6-methylguanine-DNA--protein-cysteine methyltransferase
MRMNKRNRATQLIAQSEPDGFAVMAQFDRLLAEADTLEQVSTLRSKADMLRAWAKSVAASLEAQNRAAECKLRTERKLGQMLAQVKLRGGNRRSNGHDDRLILDDIGITQNQSKRWQRLGAVPEGEFDNYVKRATDLGTEVTAAGLLRACRPIVSAAFKKRAHTCKRGASERPSSNLASTLACEGGVAAQLATVLDAAQEAMQHQATLAGLLAPDCTGHLQPLLPGERKAVSYYVSELGRLLSRIVAIESGDGSHARRGRRS